MEEKKYPNVDLSHKSGLFFNIGLVISLVFVITLFEWRFYDDGSLVDLGRVEDTFEDLLDIPPTEQPPPPPPVIQQPEIIEIPDEEIIEQEIEVNLDIEITEETVIESLVFEEAPEEEIADEIFSIVEEQPSPDGGMEAFYKYLGKNMVYPPQAQRMSIDGRVYVQFVVDIDGSLRDVVVIKGIGYGCDEEAIRIVKSAPKWNPGKQRGRPVKVRMVVPVFFKLL